MAFMTLSFYMCPETLCILPASLIRDKKGWVKVGKLQCNQQPYEAEDLGDGRVQIYRTLYGKRVDCHIISKK